jgi:hypothetical protein
MDEKFLLGRRASSDRIIPVITGAEPVFIGLDPLSQGGDKKRMEFNGMSKAIIFCFIVCVVLGALIGWLIWG